MDWFEEYMKQLDAEAEERRRKAQQEEEEEEEEERRRKVQQEAWVECDHEFFDNDDDD
jgi:hypothetical protein